MTAISAPSDVFCDTVKTGQRACKRSCTYLADAVKNKGSARSTHLLQGGISVDVYEWEETIVTSAHGVSAIEAQVDRESRHMCWRCGNRKSLAI